MQSTCSCKDYFHYNFCVHILCMIAMSVLEFQIPVVLIQCDPELSKRLGRQKYIAGGNRTGGGERLMESDFGRTITNGHDADAA